MIKHFFLQTLLIAFLLNNTIWAEELKVEIEKKSFSVRVKSDYSGDEKDSFYLKLLEKLPEGTIVTYDTDDYVSKVLYDDLNGEIKRSRSSFFKAKVNSLPDGGDVSKYSEVYISKTVIEYVRIDRSNYVGSRALKKLDIRYKVYDQSVLPSGAKTKYYMKKMFTLPKGSSFSFDPYKVIELPYYKNSNGAIKKSSGRYIGPLYFSKIPGKSQTEIDQLNDLKLYTFEKGISLDEMNKKLYSIPNRFDHIKIKDKVLWDNRSYTANWSKMAKSLVLDNARVFIENPPSDIKEYCPKYEEKSDEDRAEFWVHLMAAISKYESNFQPGRINDESAFGNGLEVVSRGLLQISYSSVQSPKIKRNGCHLERKEDLHHPQKNLKCALSLFKVLTSGSGKNCISCKYTEEEKKDRFAGIAFYWSTLRPEYEVNCKVCSGGKVKIGHKSVLTGITKKLSICN